MFFEVDSWPSAGFLLDRRLTCGKRSLVVQKPVNAKPGLKFNRSINISCIQMFFTSFLFA